MNGYANLLRGREVPAGYRGAALIRVVLGYRHKVAVLQNISCPSIGGMMRSTTKHRPKNQSRCKMLATCESCTSSHITARISCIRNSGTEPQKHGEVRNGIPTIDQGRDHRFEGRNESRRRVG